MEDQCAPHVPVEVSNSVAASVKCVMYESENGKSTITSMTMLKTIIEICNCIE